MQQNYSLYELTRTVQEAVYDTLPDTYRVTAEISELRVNASGHCYLELVEKSPSGNELLARARAVIWNNLYPSIKAYFEEETHQTLTCGIKVLVEVKVNFHPLYGFSLTITDIDPSYTIGDLAMRRKEILRRLEEEGIADMNKELPLAELPQRIAVISSDTAAGYGDFCHQLAGNTHHFNFTTRLFPAVMQGDRVEKSIIRALDHISERLDDFDVVVIIRGGGATTDLAGFDSLALAENCAQFPLPIITGIGHERDDTVLDLISHTRVKTPTAAAEFLIACMTKAEERLQTSITALADSVRKRMDSEQALIDRYTRLLPLLYDMVRNREDNRLQQLNNRLSGGYKLYLTKEEHQLQTWELCIKSQVTTWLQNAASHLHLLEEKTKAADPARILKKGYTLTLKDGKIVRDGSTLKQGDHITTHFLQGDVQSTVN